LGVDLPEEVLGFLANRIRANVRRLEGALVRVTSYTALTGQKVTIDVAEALLCEVLHEEGRQSISIELIQKQVAEHFNIRLADMSSKRRPENIAFPRQVAMYLCRQMTQSSLSHIGEAFGGRDHCTVSHACRVVQDRMLTDARTRQEIQHIEHRLTL
jgi:chromosomal replication initiator protein